MTLEPTILPINPDTFEYQTYSNSDEQLIFFSKYLIYRILCL